MSPPRSPCRDLPGGLPDGPRVRLRPGLRSHRLLLSDSEELRDAAAALASGTVVAHGFANIYALTARPDVTTVRHANRLRGRPADDTGSITTTPSGTSALLDWAALPTGLTRHAVLGLIDAVFELGPFGFRVPAAAQVPDHLTVAADSVPGRIRTAEVIAPGYRCSSNAFLSAALDPADEDLLHTAPASWREPTQTSVDELAADVRDATGVLVLAHPDEFAIRRASAGGVRH